MTQLKISNNQKSQKHTYVTRFYSFLSVIAVIFMIMAAYITYGYQVREVMTSFNNVVPKVNDKNNSANKNTINVGVDLSRVPNDDTIVDILNDIIPNVCDNCEKDAPLDCLKKYKFNKVLVQNSPHQDHLFIKFMTGKNNDHLYTVVIDLANNNQVIQTDGQIDKDSCRDVMNESVNESFFKEGQDPENNGFVDTNIKSIDIL